MSKFNWLQIKSNANDAGDTEIIMHGEIGNYFDAMDAQSVSQQLREAKGNRINIRMNSGGGSMFVGHALYNVLKQSGKEIHVYNDSIIASAATLPACAGIVHMPRNAMYMVHHPYPKYGTEGNANELRKMADLLDKFADTIANVYVQKTGLDKAKLIEMMDNETWLNAEEALELGFVDHILEHDVDIAACVKNKDIAACIDNFKNLPPHAVNIVESSNKSQGDDHPMNLEELKAKAPEVYAVALEEGKKAIDTKAIAAAAAKAERERIKSIQDAANVGHETIVAQAIENGWDAGQFALAAMKADKEAGKTAFENRKNDAAVVANVPVTAAPEANTEDDSIDAALDAAFNGV